MPGLAFGDQRKGEWGRKPAFRSLPSRTPGAPCILTVFATGSLPRTSHNPAVPITVPEQLDSTEAAFEAGAPVSEGTGREDSVWPCGKTLAPSHAALVKRVADLGAEFERPVAAPGEARAILGLAAGPRP